MASGQPASSTAIARAGVTFSISKEDSLRAPAITSQSDIAPSHKAVIQAKGCACSKFPHFPQLFSSIFRVFREISRRAY